MGLLVDLRRRTTHQENIDALIQYSKDLQAFIKKLEAIEEPTSAMLEAVSLLSTLKTVKKSDAEKLVAAGILTIEDLAYCELDKVTKKTGIDEDTLTVMIKDALKKV
jgi:isopentenyl diphosphate isomerase/L-lactate dehydrogenase-like FMN-dependent dehydrogenase